MFETRKPIQDFIDVVVDRFCAGEFPILFMGDVDRRPDQEITQPKTIHFNQGGARIRRFPFLGVSTALGL